MWVSCTGCLLSASLLSIRPPTPRGDADDSISDEQRAVIDPSPRARRGGLAGLLLEVSPEHDRREVSLRERRSVWVLCSCVRCLIQRDNRTWRTRVAIQEVKSFANHFVGLCIIETVTTEIFKNSKKLIRYFWLILKTPVNEVFFSVVIVFPSYLNCELMQINLKN